MRPAASAYSVSAYLQPQFATLNTRCLIFYKYQSCKQSDSLSTHNPSPPKKHKHAQTQNCPLQLSDARSVCLGPPSSSSFQLTTWFVTTPQVQELPFWNGRGEKKQKNPNRKWNTSFHKDISLSLSSENLFSQRRNSYATKTRSPKLKFVSDHLLQNCTSIQRDFFFVNGVPAAQESSDSRSVMQKLFASNEIDRARRQLEYSRSASISLCLRRAATDVSGLRSP